MGAKEEAREHVRRSTLVSKFPEIHLKFSSRSQKRRRRRREMTQFLSFYPGGWIKCKSSRSRSKQGHNKDGESESFLDYLQKRLKLFASRTGPFLEAGEPDNRPRSPVAGERRRSCSGGVGGVIKMFSPGPQHVYKRPCSRAKGMLSPISPKRF